MKAHPLAELFPLMEGNQFTALVADIKANGQREPIVLYEDKILDGRNRYRACIRAKIEPTFKNYKGKDPLGFVISLNLNRRHLDESQRAWVARKLCNRPEGRPSKTTAIAVVSQEDAAVIFNVSIDSIGRANIVHDKGIPELHHAVAQGCVAVSRAAAIAKKPVSFQRFFITKINEGKKSTEATRLAHRRALPARVAKLPDGKHRVIYADPPWQYNDARQTDDHRESTGAIDHYSTMTFDELKALNIKSLAADDCVLLLWGTFPLLPEALDLLKVWGFEYKQAFVWNKKHGAFGSYHDAEAELLFVATIGSCVPEIDKKEKQIQSFARGKHSHKPEEWRALIDKLWPSGPRIELFRRGNVPRGWKTWGAEAT